MAKKKKMTPEQELKQYRESLLEEFERWGRIRLHGCDDPCLTDGQNLNEAMSNIFWYRLKIHEICAANGLPYPPEYLLDVPPEAPTGYMASLDQTERVKRLWSYGYELTTEWGGDRGLTENEAITALGEIQQYRAIGAVDECREAMERQIPKEPGDKRGLMNFAQEIYAYRGDCPVCGAERLISTNGGYCPRCGQAIDWEG